MIKMSLALAFVLGFTGSVFAQDSTTTDTEGQTKMTIEDAKDSKNAVAGDLDAEITNAKLRAESGSKSRWSMSITGTYSGASLEKPLDKFRPNTSQETTPPRVSVGGDISARMRIDKNQSLSLGTGFSMQDPLHEGKYGDISDPYVSYNNARKIGVVQNIVSGSLVAATNNDELTIGTIGTADINDTLLYDFNGSKLTVGLLGDLSYTLYQNNKDKVVSYRNDPNEKFPAGAEQRDYSIGVYPVAEYAISDLIQLRTVFRPWIFDHNVFRAGDTFHKRRWTQSFGVGFAVTRDIYLYPNFQWDVEQWRGKDYNFANKEVRANSTVALSATLNVF